MRRQKRPKVLVLIPHRRYPPEAYELRDIVEWVANKYDYFGCRTISEAIEWLEKNHYHSVYVFNTWLAARRWARQYDGYKALEVQYMLDA